MKAYLINPTERTIGEVAHTGHIEDTRCLIGGGSGFAKQWQDGTTLYVDDDGLSKNIESGFVIADLPDPLVGNGLVVGPELDMADQDELEQEVVKTSDPGISLDQLRAEVRFLTRDELLAWPNSKPA